jgi:hypothetical protein
MNKKQKSLLWLGIIVFVLFVLCPPWIEVVRYPSSAAMEIPIGSYPIWDPPQLKNSESNWVGAKVDAGRLSLEWLAVIVLTVAMTWSVRSKTGTVAPINSPTSLSPAKPEETPCNMPGEAMTSPDANLHQPQSGSTLEVTKCPVCRAENPGRLKYCPDCGVLQKPR